jgi:hypothetical protein
MTPCPRLSPGTFLVALATALLGFQLAPGGGVPGVIEGASAGMTASDEGGGAAPAPDLERRVQALERHEAEARRERAALREEIAALRQRLEILQALQIAGTGGVIVKGSTTVRAGG